MLYNIMLIENNKSVTKSILQTPYMIVCLKNTFSYWLIIFNKHDIV